MNNKETARLIIHTFKNTKWDTFRTHRNPHQPKVSVYSLWMLKHWLKALISLYFLVFVCSVFSLQTLHSALFLFIFLVTLIRNYHLSPSLLCVHIYLFSFNWRKLLCESKRTDKFSCAILFYLCLPFGDLLFFSVRAFPFYSYFCVIHTSSLSFPFHLIDILKHFYITRHFEGGTQGKAIWE